MEGKNMARVTNEVLANELSNLGKNIESLTSRFDSFESQYARSDLLELRFRELDTRFAQIDLQIVSLKKEMKEDMARVEKEAKRATWKSHTLTAVLTLLATLAVSYIFNDLLTR